MLRSRRMRRGPDGTAERGPAAPAPRRAWMSRPEERVAESDCRSWPHGMVLEDRISPRPGLQGEAHRAALPRRPVPRAAGPAGAGPLHRAVALRRGTHQAAGRGAEPRQPTGRREEADRTARRRGRRLLRGQRLLRGRRLLPGQGRRPAGRSAARLLAPARTAVPGCAGSSGPAHRCRGGWPPVRWPGARCSWAGQFQVGRAPQRAQPHDVPLPPAVGGGERVHLG